MGSNKDSTSANFGDIEDLIHNFLIIILEHSMRQKDGWKVNFLLFYTHFGLPLSFSLSLSLSLTHTHTHTLTLKNACRFVIKSGRPGYLF